MAEKDDATRLAAYDAFAADVRDELAVAHAHLLKIISARLRLHFYARNIESKLNGLIGHHSSLPGY